MKKIGTIMVLGIISVALIHEIWKFTGWIGLAVLTVGLILTFINEKEKIEGD